MPPSAQRKLEVGVLGATGMVGQQFVRLLDSHPWFDATWFAASDRSEGRTYEGAAPWRLTGPMPERARDMRIESCVPGRGPRLVFSALDAAAARDIEPAFAAAGHIVVSNTRTFRMDPDVPLVIPEVNGDHLVLVRSQRHSRGWPGAIVTNPNCSTVVLSIVLAALRRFRITRVMVSTMQAVSGAGYPGVASLDILGNVIPFIPGEEEKIQSETQKILGTLQADGIVPHPMAVSAQTTRVAVADGHTETIAIAFDDQPGVDEVKTALAAFRARPQELNLPTAPPAPVVCLEAPDRPQPRLDANRDGGMTITVGRVRPCGVLDVKLVALGHNTIRGAAGAAILNAELMVADGLIEDD